MGMSKIFHDVGRLMALVGLLFFGFSAVKAEAYQYVEAQDVRYLVQYRVTSSRLTTMPDLCWGSTVKTPGPYCDVKRYYYCPLTDSLTTCTTAAKNIAMWGGLPGTMGILALYTSEMSNFTMTNVNSQTLVSSIIPMNTSSSSVKSARETQVSPIAAALKQAAQGSSTADSSGGFVYCWMGCTVIPATSSSSAASPLPPRSAIRGVDVVEPVQPSRISQTAPGLPAR